MKHLFCYSKEFKTEFVGTTMRCEKEDVFKYLEGVFKEYIERVVVVETGEVLVNRACKQMELFLE